MMFIRLPRIQSLIFNFWPNRKMILSPPPRDERGSARLICVARRIYRIAASLIHCAVSSTHKAHPRFPREGESLLLVRNWPPPFRAGERSLSSTPAGRRQHIRWRNVKARRPSHVIVSNEGSGSTLLLRRPRLHRRLPFGACRHRRCPPRPPSASRQPPPRPTARRPIVAS